MEPANGALLLAHGRAFIVSQKARGVSQWALEQPRIFTMLFGPSQHSDFKDVF